MQKETGILVFAVDTVADRCPDSDIYQASVMLTITDGALLTLHSKSYYDEKTRTQFSPSIYERRSTDALLSEEMDFQAHLYALGEMDSLLAEIGFPKVQVYSSFQKGPALSNDSEMFLYECRLR